MRHGRTLAVSGALVFSISLAGCAGDSAKTSADTVTSSGVVQAEDQPASGEVQERAVSRMGQGVPDPTGSLKQGGTLSQPIKPGATGPVPPPGPPPTGSKSGSPQFTPPGPLPLPGEFAIATASRGTYLFAAYGGGRTNDAIVTSSPGLTINSKFRLYAASPSAPAYKYIQTVNGYFLMAPDGGGHADSSAIVTDLHQFPYGVYTDIAKFRFVMVPSVGNGVSTIQTINGNFVTAVGGGGQLTNAVHTDAKTAQLWEYFRVPKCGDLGSGWTYAIQTENITNFTFTAPGGGGRTQGAIANGTIDSSARFTLIRQADGTYALRTPNGINYVTAVGGGGRADDNAFHTDATQVQAWEKFRFLDQGDCRYTIQTVSGGFVGSAAPGTAITNLSAPTEAHGYAFWYLYMFDL